MLVNYSKYFSLGLRKFVCGFRELEIFYISINRYIYRLYYFTSYSKLLVNLRSKDDHFNPPKSKREYFYTTIGLGLK